MHGDKLLQRSQPAEAEHGTFHSSERLMGILRAIVEPATGFAVVTKSSVLKGSPVGPKLVRHQNMRATRPLHRLEAPEGGALGHLTRLGGASRRWSSRRPRPGASGAGRASARPACDGSWKQTQSPPGSLEPKSLVTGIDALIVDQVLPVVERKGGPDVRHHRQAYDLSAGGPEGPVRRKLGHPPRLGYRSARLNQFSSDTGQRGVPDAGDRAIEPPVGPRR